MTSTATTPSPLTGPSTGPSTGSVSALATGLTATDAARISAAVAAGHAETTRTVYASAWRRWEVWCATRGLPALPATSAAVCAYLTERAEQGVSIRTIDLACSAIAYEHRNRGVEEPTADQAVRQVRRGLRRTLGTAPRRRARPLNVADIRQILNSINRSTPLGARDAAIILLGFASALRRAELAALTLTDLEAKPGGLLVTIHNSKTDQDSRGQVIGVAHGQHAETDPVAAVASWTAMRGTTPGPLFTSMRGGHPSRTGKKELEPISGSAVARILKTRAAAAGLPTERITGHSLRAGHATTAAMAGVGIDRIAAQTRHRSITTLIEHYIRPIQALETTSSRDLGL